MIVVILVIVLWFVMKKPAVSEVPNTATNTDTSAQTATSQGANVINAIPENPDVSAVKNSGDSDSSLTKDTASIDAQLKDLGTDTTNASVKTTK